MPSRRRSRRCSRLNSVVKTAGGRRPMKTFNFPYLFPERTSQEPASMATAAQIEANRLNAQKSTGPKTERGKARAKLNAITHGMTARTIMPVLPQEAPKELEDRTQQAITAMKPRNPLEHDLVCRAVRLAGELDRAERVATAHLAQRVRMAARSGPETVSARELKKVHELGSKLFFKAGIGPGYSSATADDYPAVIVRSSKKAPKVAAGCSLAGPNY